MKNDTFLIVLVILAIVIPIAAMILGISKYQSRTQLATESDCTYLGSPRDLKQVGFYDCNGSVVARLDK
jgi:hypothetical protein